MDNVKKSHSSTSKAAINRYPKLEKYIDPLIPIEEVKDDSPEAYISSVCFPYIRGENCNRLLPNYSTVLGRTARVGAFVEDLDQLQHDLEKLLSFASVRNRLLREQLDQSTGKKEYQDKTVKRKQLETLSPACIKRMHLEQKRKLRLSKAGRRFIRGKHRGKGKGLSGLVGNCSFGGNDSSIRQPRVFIPRNDLSEKFWASVEPYCVDINRDDTHFLENLIKECSIPTTVHIPEVGVHYALEWSNQFLSLEKHISEEAIEKRKIFPIVSELQKNGTSFLTNHIDISCDSPINDRLLETVPSDPILIPKVNGKPETLTVTNEQNGQNGTRVGVCMEHRLRPDLISDTENRGPSQSGIRPITPSDNEILMEFQRCCRELDTINRYNVVELTKLREKCMNDLKRQALKATMNKVDKEVLDLYSEIGKAKQAHAATFTRPNLQPYEKQALEIRKHQIALYKSYSRLIAQTDENNESDDLSDD